uniref:Uncharacterized protein n=1 Tax=Cucumis melo TaxID=3656 RepID=A0A9I9EAL9_CUCME
MPFDCIRWCLCHYTVTFLTLAFCKIIGEYLFSIGWCQFFRIFHHTNKNYFLFSSSNIKTRLAFILITVRNMLLYY